MWLFQQACDIKRRRNVNAAPQPFFKELLLRAIPSERFDLIAEVKIGLRGCSFPSHLSEPFTPIALDIGTAACAVFL